MLGIIYEVRENNLKKKQDPWETELIYKTFINNLKIKMHLKIFQKLRKMENMGLQLRLLANKRSYRPIFLIFHNI